MPTQRPFLSNFLAAFRSHRLPKASPSISASTSVTPAATFWPASATRSQTPAPSESTATNPRPINSKSNPYPPPAAWPPDPSPSDQSHQLSHVVSPSTHLPVYGPPNKPATPAYPTVQEARRRRRGSDSSSDSGGFREVRAPPGEKWFIGGRTAAGEERYFPLRMVRRERSADRISADRLSL